MKRLTFLFLLLMLAGITNNLKGQTFFKDSTVYFSYRGMPTVSHSGPAIIGIVEVVRLDSITTNGEFYTVHRVEKAKNGIYGLDSLDYQLKVQDNKVYFSGLYKISWPDDSNYVDNMLLYDFTLKVGDTFGKHFNSFFDKEYLFKVDSIGLRMFEDKKQRETFYFSTIKSDVVSYSPYFISKGFGSLSGLIFFPLIDQNYVLKKLLSVCSGNQIIFHNESYWDYRLPNANHCSVDDFWELLRTVSIDEDIFTNVAIFPNPATQTIYISGFENSKYFIYNQLGDIVLEGVLLGKINIESLVEGVYILKLVDETGVYSGKFLKQ